MSSVESEAPKQNAKIKHLPFLLLLWKGVSPAPKWTPLVESLFLCWDG